MLSIRRENTLLCLAQHREPQLLCSLEEHWMSLLLLVAFHGTGCWRLTAPHPAWNNTGLPERAPRRWSKWSRAPCVAVTSKTWGLIKADTSPTARNQLQGRCRMWLPVTPKPHVPAFQPWPLFFIHLPKNILQQRSLTEQKRLDQKQKSDWCIMQHAVTTRELDFDMLAEVCYFYSGTWWSIRCQHLYNIKHLHPYGECIIKACCIQLWKLSHILPKLHCNPQMRAGSQNGKSLA